MIFYKDLDCVFQKLCVDEPKGLLLVRRLELEILDRLLGRDVIRVCFSMSGVMYHMDESETLSGKRRTRMGCFYRFIKDRRILNSQQLRTIEVSAQRLVRSWKKGKMVFFNNELKYWEELNLAYGEITPTMRWVLSTYEKKKRDRKRWRKKIIENHKPVEIKRLTYR